MGGEGPSTRIAEEHAADITHGSGLVGLTDRVETLGGRMSLHSPAGEGTHLEFALPLS